MKTFVKKLFKSNSLTEKIWDKLSYLNLRLLVWLSPEYVANRTYRGVFGKDIKWDNPTNLIEKIYWLQFNSDTSLWTKCADKYRVRDYVVEKGCGNILNELYGNWDDVEDIDFDSLPNSFVLKTNNSCGQILLVKDKSKLDVDFAKKQLKKWLDSKYGFEGAQLHYTKIEPCVIAEELLVNKNTPESSLVDYKIWCFNGIPEFVLVVAQRKSVGEYSLSAYDLQWNNISDRVLNKKNVHYDGFEIVCPSSFNEMIEYAKKLSQGFPEVRVDFYDIDGKVIFGELTFTTGYGSYNLEYYEYLGSKITLPKKKYNQ